MVNHFNVTTLCRSSDNTETRYLEALLEPHLLVAVLLDLCVRMSQVSQSVRAGQRRNLSLQLSFVAPNKQYFCTTPSICSQ